MPRAIDFSQPSMTMPQTAAPPSVQDTAGGVPVAPAVGWQAGAFRILPSITAGAFYDDNVFARNANRQADWAMFVRPEIAARNVGPGHAFEAAAALEARRYSRFQTEDQVNGTAAAAGTVMTDPNGQLQGRIRYTRGHEDRNSGESILFPAPDRPTAYDQVEAAGAINRRSGRTWASFGGAASWINYEPVVVAGVPFTQVYRNGIINVVSGRVGYVVAPLTSVFAEVAGNERHFGVENFSSRGYRVVGGVLLEPGQGATMRGEVFAGYMNQDYIGPTFETVSTWTYGAGLAWLIAPRVTAVFEGRREAKESALNPTGAVNGGVSLIETLAGARVDFVVVPNVIFGAGVTYLVDEFLAADRNDRSLSPLLSLKYLATRNLTFGIDYRRVDFNSSGTLAGLPYDRNVVLFSVNARL